MLLRCLLALAACVACAPAAVVNDSDATGRRGGDAGTRKVRIYATREDDIRFPVRCNCTGQSCEADGTCVTTGGCAKSLRRLDGTTDIATYYECIAPGLWVPDDRPLGCHVYTELQHKRNMRCCRDRDFCAADLHVELKDEPAQIIFEENHSTPYSKQIIITLAILLLFCLCTGIFLVFAKRCLNTKLGSRLGNKPTELQQPMLPLSAGGGGAAAERDTCVAVAVGNSGELAGLNDTLRILEEAAAADASSGLSVGSGVGLPLMMQQSIARQIDLPSPRSPVGTGRFGAVYLGLWKGEKVAVKIFKSVDEASWFREVEVFQTTMLRHPNILAFIASDNKDTGDTTELWLVTEFHKHGALYDYMYAKQLTPFIFCRMARSIANGLAFLHSHVPALQINGSHANRTITKTGKPAVAHCDIKSKNILVKSDLSCCIGDMGMCVRYMCDEGGDAARGELDKPLGRRIGTKRYLAPEFLDGSLNESLFDSYRRADMYSFGLVLWEMARRTDCDGHVWPYELPYFDVVPADPDKEQMRQAVVTNAYRPTVPNPWTRHPVLAVAARFMQECWASNPAARLTALRVRKTIDQLVADVFGEDHSIAIG